MANPQHLRKVGAHSNHEPRPCDPSSTRPAIAPDSQPTPTCRKRKRGTPPSEIQDTLPQTKHRSTISSSAHSSPSSQDRIQREYWDTLSRVWLTRSALREFNRRNRLLRANAAPTTDTVNNHKQRPKDINRFARHGGPDLSNIRQCSSYPTVSESMPPRRKPSGQSPAGGESLRKSSAYTPNFGQKLVDNHISLFNRNTRATNHQEWDEVLRQPRPSVSPSRISDGQYDSFVAAIDEAHNEAGVMSGVLPQILGSPRYPSRQNVKFRNLDTLAKGTVIPQPDYYEGEIPGPGNRQLRGQLEKIIVPSSRTDCPFLPNFFAEAKSLDGTLRVGRLQACQDGALGSRAMHMVENLGRREEVFDNKARTASVIYHGDGTLAFSTHHHSQPRGPGTPAQTYMTPLRSITLSDSPTAFREGVGAFRNASDYAHQLRKESIENAHRRMEVDTPEPPTFTSRSTRRPLSCQAPLVESRDSSTSTSSEEEDSDDDNNKGSSRAYPNGMPLKPKVVIVSPKRPARRSPSPRRLRPRRGSRRP